MNCCEDPMDDSHNALYKLSCTLTHYGGWHSGATGDDGFLSHVCHSGDGESFVARSLEFYLTFFLVHPLVPRLRTPTRSGPWSA